jgi:hypothetical protein
MGAGALAPGRVCTEFPKDKEFRAFEMLEKIGFSLKPRRCAVVHEDVEIEMDVEMATAQPSKVEEEERGQVDTPVVMVYADKKIQVSGSTRCDHGLRTRCCKTHGTKYFCEHGRQKHQCKECGTGYCHHNRQKYQCKECGTGYCIHGRQKLRCRDFGTGHALHPRSVEAPVRRVRHR